MAFTLRSTFTRAGVLHQLHTSSKLLRTCRSPFSSLAGNFGNAQRQDTAQHGDYATPSNHTPPTLKKHKDIDLTKYSHLFANPRVKAIIDRIVRVDQAGEFGAARMYLSNWWLVPVQQDKP
jgi:hypothetical protein